MFQNLNIRWTIIIAIVIGAIYFITPTYNYYSITNDPDLTDIIDADDIKVLKEDALKLGLDLQGGLYIILELDYHAYLLQQANSKQSSLYKQDLSELITQSILLSIENQTDVLDQFHNTALDQNIELKTYYSNLLRSNVQTIDNIDNQILIILKENRK